MKPFRLRPGDTVAIVAPSSHAAALFPHRIDAGQWWLESQGYRVVRSDHLLGNRGWVSGTPEERAADLHALFARSDVHAIIAAIGGDHACHLLPLLDWDLIRRNPKIFMGYSDITVLNVAMHVRTGLVTFNGPCVMTELADHPEPLAYTAEWFQKTLCEIAPPGRIHPATDWTEERLEWADRSDRSRPRHRLPSPGWTWLKPGRARGRLLGGCLESLQHLRGTPYWPDFEGAILFIETSELAPSPAWVDGVLQDYENMGIFAKLSGLLVGRPMGYTNDQKALLRQVILERTRRYGFPIVTDMDFGHTSPQFILPLGCEAKIDATAEVFSVIEAAVRA